MLLVTFPGASATRAPASNEILWLVYVGAGGQGGDWNELNIWADKVSENTDYEISAAGVNMMYGKAKANAEAELVVVIIPSIFLLGLILTIEATRLASGRCNHRGRLSGDWG